MLICSRAALVAQLVERSPRLQCRGFESHLGQVLVVVVVLFAFDDCFGSRCKHICVVSPQTRLELREKERRMLETTTLCPAWSRWRKTFRPLQGQPLWHIHPCRAGGGSAGIWHYKLSIMSIRNYMGVNFVLIKGNSHAVQRVLKRAR